MHCICLKSVLLSWRVGDSCLLAWSVVPCGRFNRVAQNSKISLMHSHRSCMVRLTWRCHSFRRRIVYSCVVRITVV